jgi:endonuclease YncB( thermonuclease family)
MIAALLIAATVSVLNGDTATIDGTTIRIANIDGPERLGRAAMPNTGSRGRRCTPNRPARRW